MDQATAMLIASLAAGLGPALFGAFKSVAEKGLVEPSLERGLRGLSDWVGSGYDRAKNEAVLQDALAAAVEDVRQQPGMGSLERYLVSSRLTHPSDEACDLLAAVLVQTPQPDPATLPPRLLKALDWPDEQRSLLAHFLRLLRQRLADTDLYGRKLQYVNDLAQLNRLDDLTRGVSTLLAERRLTENDSQALDDYLADLSRRLGEMRLPMMHKRTHEAVLAHLKDIFVPLRLQPDPAQPGAARKNPKRSRLASETTQAEMNERAETSPIEFSDLLNRSERFILLGPPGCGKSTLLSWVALALAEGRARQEVNWQGGPRLPMFVRLRNFAAFLRETPAGQAFCEPASGALIAYLDHRYRTELRLPLSPDFFDRRLKEGNCFALLDGLDEVSSQRDLVAQHITAFIEDYGFRGNRFGLSSRPGGYETVELLLRPARLTVVQVNPLEPAGIRRLVANLLALLDPDPRQRSADTEKLMRAILARRELTQLAGVPLMCSALVQLYKHHGTELPQRRVDVFEELVDLLLGYWHAQKEINRPNDLAADDGTGRLYSDLNEAIETKRRRLSHLALEMQKARQAVIAADQAQTALAAYLLKREKALSSRRDARLLALDWAMGFLRNSHDHSGLLVEQEPGEYTFLHQGFREYLAARALVDHSRELTQTALDHAGDDWWEPVILLAGASSALPEDDRCDLVNAFLSPKSAPERGSDRWRVNLLTAVGLARDMGDGLPPPEYEAVEQVLQAAMTDADLPPAQRAEAADLLDELGWLPEGLFEFIAIDPAQLPQAAQRLGLAGAAPFWIGRYPVTNWQYARFLQPENFADQSLWVDFPCYDEKSRLIPTHTTGLAGWDWLRESLKDLEDAPDGRILYPRYWNDPRFGIARRAAPVVGVSWWEASAYARWLGREGARQPEAANPALRLPTSAEWLLAAGGDQPEARYPWDDPFADATTTDEAQIVRCANVDESGIGRTTPVGMYPQGCSLPFGLWDLAGNVWEWQANYADKDQNSLGLRGGSWDLNGWIARPAQRGRGGLRYGDDLFGFRLWFPRP